MTILTVFGQFRFRMKMYFGVFGFFSILAENVHLESLQSIWQQPLKRIKWACSL